jgi:hypothetical protein
VTETRTLRDGHWGSSSGWETWNAAYAICSTCRCQRDCETRECETRPELESRRHWFLVPGADHNDFELPAGDALIDAVLHLLRNQQRTSCASRTRLRRHGPSCRRGHTGPSRLRSRPVIVSAGHAARTSSRLDWTWPLRLVCHYGGQKRGSARSSAAERWAQEPSAKHPEAVDILQRGAAVGAAVRYEFLMRLFQQDLVDDRLVPHLPLPRFTARPRNRLRVKPDGRRPVPLGGIAAQRQIDLLRLAASARDAQSRAASTPRVRPTARPLSRPGCPAVGVPSSAAPPAESPTAHRSTAACNL